MLRLLLIPMLLLLFSGCYNKDITVTTPSAPKVEKANSNLISKIAIPFEEKGYENFTTTIITEQPELDNFIALVTKQTNWKAKENFLNVLQTQTIDFSTDNLLIYRFNEKSSSILIAVDVPTATDNHIYVKIGRDDSNIAHSDITFYALAYKISKNAVDITFDDNIQKVIIANKKTISMVPKNCMEWFDGCNNCGRVGKEGTPVCTEIHCDTYEEFHCTKWKEE